MANCPICAKPASATHAPFCSKRCMELDLMKWLKGNYAVPAVELDDVSDEDLGSDDGEQNVS